MLWLLNIFVFFYGLWPRIIKIKFGQLIGWFLFHFDKRHREEITSRITLSIKDQVDEEPKKTCRKFYDNFGLLISEILDLKNYDSERIKEYVDGSEIEKVLKTLEKGKGIILLPGHFSNWELAGLAMAEYKVPIHSVAKTLKSKTLDKFFNQIRSSTGQKIIQQENAYKEMLRTIKNKKAVALLLDYDASPNKGGLFVPFFHANASTLPTAALLSLKTGAPMMVARAERLEDKKHFKIFFSDEFTAFNSGNKEDDVYKAVLEMNRWYEKFIMECPSQWLWLQRRWRFDQKKYENSPEIDLRK